MVLQDAVPYFPWRSGMRPARPHLALLTRAVGAIALAGALLATSTPPVPAASSAVGPTPVSAKRADGANPVTPGDFTGFGFDQCLAPTQAAMDTWLETSPFLAVGIYISGDSRACRNQPNLTPAWISTQLAKGWRLLPITLGPQASCQPRFPRYQDDFKIDPSPGAGRYGKARAMGVDSATTTVADATALGLTPGSTLWYDLEGFDLRNTNCRESALAFVSAWSAKVTDLGFVPGLYSSASSGIKMVDDARVNRPGEFTLPTRIWLARWDGVANTSSSYLREDGWRPGHRVKQYRGGHNETHGGVTINIDSNYLDLGAGSRAPAETHCGGVTISFRAYEPLHPPKGDDVSPPSQVRALQCLLQERGVYAGKIDGRYHRGVQRAVAAWQTKRGMTPSGRWYRREWMSVLSYGAKPVLKVGSAGFYVRRAQRALNAADLGVSLKNTGVYDAAMGDVVSAYQKRVGLSPNGVLGTATWTKLFAGVRSS